MQHENTLTNAYTINAFCAAYSIGRTLVYSEIKSGRLVARKVGTRTLILKADADAWAEGLAIKRATQ